MYMETKHYFGKVTEDGKLMGVDIEQIRPDLKDVFAGQFVIVQITGVVMTADKMRGWYWAGILPTILKAMKSQGNYYIDPKGKEFVNELHGQLKELFLQPERDAQGQIKLKHGKTVYSTKGLGRQGWSDYIRSIQLWADEQFGIRLNPEQPRQ